MERVEYKCCFYISKNIKVYVWGLFQRYSKLSVLSLSLLVYVGEN